VVLEEFKTMKPLAPKKFKGFTCHGSPAFTGDMMKKFREKCSQFRPEYRCPLCKVAIRQSPVRCRNLLELEKAIMTLMSPLGNRVEQLEDDENVALDDPYPQLSAYFIFFEPQLVSLI
jgi:hypothetical protein